MSLVDEWGEVARTLPDDSWETLVAEGMHAASVKDGKNWELGDLAGRVVKRYGEDSLGRYASDIRYEKATLRDYRRVSAFYPPDVRVDFPLLRWSHYRACVRLGTLDAALDMLARASDEDWPVQALKDAVSVAVGEEPKPLRITGMARVVGVSGRRLVLEVDPDVALEQVDVDSRVGLALTVERV